MIELNVDFEDISTAFQGFWYRFHCVVRCIFAARMGRDRKLSGSFRYISFTFAASAAVDGVIADDTDDCRNQRQSFVDRAAIRTRK